MIFPMVENNINIDKFEKRAVIKYLFLKEMSGKVIHGDMLATLGDNAPCVQCSGKLASRVQTWEKQCR